jgi:hypothetical protein
MKKWIGLLVTCMLALNCFSKSDEPVGRINSVRKESGENKSGIDLGILKINTTQSGKTFKGILRVSMLMEGKNGKTAWGVIKRTQKTGTVHRGEHEGLRATGAVSWNCEGFNSQLKRPKLKAYAVEYGYMENGEFIVLEDDLYKIDSFEKFKSQHQDSLPLEMKLSYIYTVD